MHKAFLVPTFAAVLLLGGCAANKQVSPEAALKHTPEFQYQSHLSRATNLATEFSVRAAPDQKLPEGVEYSGDGSLLLEGAAIASLRHTFVGNGFLSGTADFNLFAGFWLLESLLLPSNDPTPDSLVGYVRAEEAQDSEAAVNAFVAKAVPAIAESLKKQEQFKDFQISYHFEKKWTGKNDAGIEVVNEALGCKPWKDTTLGIGQCGIEIHNFGIWSLKPQISTPRFTDPQIHVWYIQGKDVRLNFYDSAKKIDWAKAMMATAPDLPEYVYAYITTRKGPPPERAKNPPFFVEKDRVNFFIKPTQAEEKKKPDETAPAK